MEIQADKKKEYRQTHMRGDKLVEGTKESIRILTGEKCEVCKKPLEKGQSRLCFSCETVVYG